MRKSNSKEARRAIEAYVLEEVETINERSEYDGKLNPARPVSSAYETLREEMSYQSDYDGNSVIMGEGLAKKYRAAGRAGFVAATTPRLVWWLACKAGCFAVSYYDQRAAIAEWLEETPEEAARYSNDDVLRTYAHLTASAFERLYNRETEPHRIPTSEFRALYDERNGGHFFDRATLKHFGETMRSFTVEGFHLVIDGRDNQVHDCYAVYHTIVAPTGERFPKVDYFDRETLSNVFPKEA